MREYELLSHDCLVTTSSCRSRLFSNLKPILAHAGSLESFVQCPPSV